MYIRKPNIARPIRRHPLVCRTLLRRAVREPKEGVLRLRAPALVPEVGVSRLSQEASGYRHLSRLFPTTPNTSYPSTVKRGDRSRSFSTSASRWLPEWSAPFLEDRPVHLSKTVVQCLRAEVHPLKNFPRDQSCWVALVVICCGVTGLCVVGAGALSREWSPPLPTFAAFR